MEDIEYLDEYKDLVLPAIKSGEGRSAAASASAVARRHRISSESSNSSSIDADIFQKLFHDKDFDDELLNEGSSKPREIHSPPPVTSSSDDDSNDAFDALFNRNRHQAKSNKKRDRYESIDAVDDLGQALMRSTQRSTVLKPSSSRGAGKKSETEGLHRGNQRPHYSGKFHSKNTHQSSSNGSSSNSVSKNSKAITLVKTQKADFRPTKNEPKTDPLNLREDSHEDSDSDSSYEFESDFYGDRDTDDEEPVIDISTDTSRTPSVADSVTPVVSDDEGESEGEGEGKGKGQDQQQELQAKMCGDSERLQIYLNNLSCAEAPPIYKKQSSAKKSRSSEKKLPSSEQVMHSKEQPAASPTAELKAATAEPEALPQRVEAGCSSSAIVRSNPFEVDPGITLDALERMTLDVAEQINEIDEERSFEFERRSASKTRSRSRSKLSADPVTNPSHVRKLTYSNEQLDSCGSSQNTLRRVKSDCGFSKRGRGRSQKHRINRAATTEEKVAKPSESVSEDVPVKKKRGRPRKIRPTTEAETALLPESTKNPTEETKKEDEALAVSSGVEEEDRDKAEQMPEPEPEAAGQQELNTELDRAKDVSEIAASSQEEISTTSSQSHHIITESSADLRRATDKDANLDVDTSTGSFDAAPQSPAAKCDTETIINELQQSGDLVWQSLDGNSNVDERMVFKSMAIELPADSTAKPEVQPDLEPSEMDVDTVPPEAVQEDDFKSVAPTAMDELPPEATPGGAVDQLPAELPETMDEGPQVLQLEAGIELTEETDAQLAEDIKLAEEILAAEVGKGIERSDSALSLPGQRLELENPVIEIIKELEQQTIADAISPPEPTEESRDVVSEETASKAPDIQPKSSTNEIGDETPSRSTEIKVKSPLPAATSKTFEVDVDMLPLATRLASRWDQTIARPRRQAAPAKRAPKGVMCELSLRSSPRLGGQSLQEHLSADETVGNSKEEKDQARSSGTMTDQGEMSRGAQIKKNKSKMIEKDKSESESQAEHPTDTAETETKTENVHAAPDEVRDQITNSEASTGDKEERASSYGKSSRTPKASTDCQRFDRRISPRTVSSKVKPHSSFGTEITPAGQLWSGPVEPESKETSNEQAQQEEPKVKRKRGRPRKIRNEETKSEKAKSGQTIPETKPPLEEEVKDSGNTAATSTEPKLLEIAANDKTPGLEAAQTKDEPESVQLETQHRTSRNGNVKGKKSSKMSVESSALDGKKLERQSQTTERETDTQPEVPTAATPAPVQQRLSRKDKIKSRKANPTTAVESGNIKPEPEPLQPAGYSKIDSTEPLKAAKDDPSKEEKLDSIQTNVNPPVADGLSTGITETERVLETPEPSMARKSLSREKSTGRKPKKDKAATNRESTQPETTAAAVEHKENMKTKPKDSLETTQPGETEPKAEDIERTIPASERCESPSGTPIVDTQPKSTEISKKRGASAKQQGNTKTIPDGASELHEFVSVTPRTAPCRQLRVLMRKGPNSTSSAGSSTPAMGLRDKNDTETDAPKLEEIEDKATAEDTPEAAEALMQSSVEQAIVDTAHQEETLSEGVPSAEAKLVEEPNEADHTEEITKTAPSIAASVEEIPKGESPLGAERAEEQHATLEVSSGEPKKVEEELHNSQSTLKIDDKTGELVNVPDKNDTESNADSPVTTETTESPVTNETAESPVSTETTGVSVATESSKSNKTVRARRKREVETPQPDEAAQRKKQQEQQLEKTLNDKQGQKKLVRRRNQLEAEERPPYKRTKLEDEGTDTASTSASTNAQAKGKFISLIGKDTIISTTGNLQEEPSKSSGGAARKSNVKNPKGSDTTKHIIISTVPKKSLEAAAASSPSPSPALASKKPLVQNLLNSNVDTRKAVQKNSTPAGKKQTAAAAGKQEPEQTIPSYTVLTKKGVVPASEMPSKKAAESCPKASPKGEGAAAALRKVNISVTVMPSKEAEGVADAAGKSSASSPQQAASAAQVTKALLNAEKNITSPRKPVDAKKKTVKPKNTEMDRNVLHRLEMGEHTTAPASKPEPLRTEEAARTQTKGVKMPGVKTNEALQKAKDELRRSDLEAFRSKATIRTAEVDTGPSSRDSSHERSGRTSRQGKGASLPTHRQMGVSMATHMTRAASSNRSLASTPIPMPATPTPTAAARRPATKKPEPVAVTPPAEPLVPPKKGKRPPRLPAGTRTRRSNKKRKGTEDEETESEATSKKRPRGEQEQEPAAREAPSIAFPVFITVASSSSQSPTPLSVTAPSHSPATAQPIRKPKLRKCRVKINRGVVKKWMETALQKPREPEPELQTEAPVAESELDPEPALDAVSAPRQPVAAVAQPVAASVSAQPAQKRTHTGILAMKLPIPIPVMEIKTELEEGAPMEVDTLPAIPIPTPAVVSTPEASAEALPPEEVVPLPTSTSSHQTIRLGAPPAAVGRLVSSIPSASAAEASQKPGHTKMFSFLYPQRYQRSYGEVGLDFCCPNLDGPMRAIDPTRLHATAQVPVLELPQFMVITTKIISKTDKDLPHKVRAKLAQLDKSGKPFGAQTVRMSTDSSEPSLPVAVPSPNLAPAHVPIPPLPAISIPPATIATATPIATPAPTIALPVAQTEVTVQSVSKQLPRATTVSKKVLAPAVAPPAAAPSLPPALIQLPPICPMDKERVELQTRVQMFDLVLQGLSRRASTLSLTERQRTIEEIVKTSTLLAIDVDVGTKLLENYIHYLNRATNTQTPMPPLRLNPVVTPAATQSAVKVSTVAKVGHASGFKRKVSTPTATATATSSAPPTKKIAQQRNSLPNKIPVYDADKTIIGYQCSKPNSSIVNRTAPKASSTPLGPSTSATAQSGILATSSKAARTGVQLNQIKKTKPTAGVAVKAAAAPSPPPPPKGNSGKTPGSRTTVSNVQPPSQQRALGRQSNPQSLRDKDPGSLLLV
ncbi:LOW QUALITY PROTEIN: serine/arginine repetitive matrix protein 2 [Drosophila subobscura]|uniref:LOW QUALITY PROTEIN: serine/arginine repetitive matrix protein 2 n=1 Tax=Drosophila subobscura TaxID=7241 RepID=UPI00155AC865|nr:LOW QUALITY PROTEIN: serine/arginine repetitive matrix protein 2 [Drosophila subobscura]